MESEFLNPEEEAEWIKDYTSIQSVYLYLNSGIFMPIEFFYTQNDFYEIIVYATKSKIKNLEKFEEKVKEIELKDFDMFKPQPEKLEVNLNRMQVTIYEIGAEITDIKNPYKAQLKMYKEMYSPEELLDLEIITKNISPLEERLLNYSLEITQ